MSPQNLQNDSDSQLKNPFADGNELDEKETTSSTEKEAPTPVEQKVSAVSEIPFHVWSTRKKWREVIIIGVAGLFSGLSSNMYFPSLQRISNDLNITPASVSWTITSYLIFQGLSPLFWGPLSDTLGRRPAYIASFVVYIGANIGLSVTPNYLTLLVLRALQSAGSASTVSIGNGAIQDISTPLERGRFLSFYQSIRNGSIAFGPILGGLLSHKLGFRSTFVFLTIASSIVLALLTAYLPETLRSIAGNGTWRLSGIHKPLISSILKEPPYMQDPPKGEKPRIRNITAGTFMEPLKMFAEPDVCATTAFGGVVYSVWSMAVASTPTLFKDRFSLDELQLGLVFLANGLGTIFGCWIAGLFMTKDFLHFEKAYLAKHPNAPPPSKTKRTLASDFALERARLRQVPWITIVLVIVTALYGFSVLPASQHLPHVATHREWIAIPLGLIFLMAAAANAVFAINTTLISDLYPGSGAGSTAVNNLVRCSLAAGGVAGVVPMLTSLGSAITFLILAGLVVASSLLLFLEWKWGMKWRAKREVRRKQRVDRAASVGASP